MDTWPTLPQAVPFGSQVIPLPMKCPVDRTFSLWLLACLTQMPSLQWSAMTFSETFQTPKSFGKYPEWSPTRKSPPPYRSRKTLMGSGSRRSDTLG